MSSPLRLVLDVSSADKSVPEPIRVFFRHLLRVTNLALLSPTSKTAQTRIRPRTRLIRFRLVARRPRGHRYRRTNGQSLTLDSFVTHHMRHRYTQQQTAHRRRVFGTPWRCHPSQAFRRDNKSAKKLGKRYLAALYQAHHRMIWAELVPSRWAHLSASTTHETPAFRQPRPRTELNPRPRVPHRLV